MPSLKKEDLLLAEAKKDLEAKCYNKAMSSAYFALRKCAERFLLSHGFRRVPRRDDKLANAIDNLGLVEVAKALRSLYALRVIADYGEQSISKEEAVNAVKIVENFIGKLKSVEKANR